MNDLKVEKKDGQQEDFDRSKLIKSMISAGADDAQANEIASKIESWAIDSAEEGLIKVADIRVKVLELLIPVAPDAAKAYEEYKKPVE
ncbi:MAG: ATP cone domain-containing protein [Patescibacteria group bacterium]|nr:hypothetical protein [Patescibacteria group bacterium]